MVFYRKRTAQVDNSVWFFWNFSLVKAPYVLAGALLFTVMYYPMMGLGYPVKDALYWVNLARLVLFKECLAQLAMFSASTMTLATIIGILKLYSY